MTELLQDGYVRVGKQCEPFVSKITIDDAEALRETLVYDFYDAVPVKQPVLTDNFNKLLAGKAFSYLPIEATDTPATFVGTMLKNYTDINTWRLFIKYSKMRRDTDNDTPLRIENHLVIEAREDELIEAYRRVKIIRTIGELTVEDIYNGVDDEGSGSNSLEKQLVTYERYATTDDIINSIDLLERTARRALVGQRRRKEINPWDNIRGIPQ